MAIVWGLIAAAVWMATEPEAREIPAVRVRIDQAREVDVAEVATALAVATGVPIARPSGRLPMPIVGLAGNLGRTMLAEALGPEVIDRGPGRLPGHHARSPQPSGRLDAAEWERKVRTLSSFVEREVQRRKHYGMHALKSYRPERPARPTVCLVHGMNSSSGGFVHMIRPLEEAGFGVVVFDYPFNRDLRSRAGASPATGRRSVARSARRGPGRSSRTRWGPWWRGSYVEDPDAIADDVSTLILIAPVNQGSSLAKAQTLLQLLNGVQAVNGRKTAEAAGPPGRRPGRGGRRHDCPAAHFLKALNAPAAAGRGVVSHPGRRRRVHVRRRRGGRSRSRSPAMRQQRGLLGGPDPAGRRRPRRPARRADATAPATAASLSRGPGSTGSPTTSTIHANHAELIRAPLLFADPGPVACMPYLLRWLGSQDGEAVAAPPVDERSGPGCRRDVLGEVSPR